MVQIGVDTGGTFTDFVFYDGREIKIHKVPSTPKSPVQAIVEGIEDVLGRNLSQIDRVEMIHGTTVPTNALLERKGAKVALVTTKGFEDAVEIGRQNREKLYDLFWERPEPLVERNLRFGVKERTAYTGKILIKLDENGVKRLLPKLKKLGVQVIAICFLHSYANSTNEKRTEKILKSLRIPISRSSRILPEFREYERTSTTIANAYLLPVVRSYMDKLSKSLPGCEVSIMHSSGGVVSPYQAGEEPVRLLLSGPAGGVVGGFNIAQAIGFQKVITYDMGGTSTDVSLCDRGIRFTTEMTLGGIPIKSPMVDVLSIGAGGGSIAYIDPGGALKVGPMSAGADPGPACYGKGSWPTVTDANLILGRLNPVWFLGGRIKVFQERSRSALEELSVEINRGSSLQHLAEGIIKVANTNMERALRVISIGRGFDPREFALVSFGGAGGLHACELAMGLGIKTVIFPKDPGVLSALGMLMADSFKDYSLTAFLSGEEEAPSSMEKNFKFLEERAKKEFPGKTLKFGRFLDARYRRQSHEITIPYSPDFIRTFHKIHKRMYGYSKPKDPVEIVTFRVRATVQRERLELPKLNKPSGGVEFQKESIFYNGREIEVGTYRRDDFYSGFKFSGPALVYETTSTSFIPPGFRCEVEEWGDIVAFT